MDPRTYRYAPLNESAPLLHSSAAAEETLVVDSRAGLTPAQMVEQKLASLLQAAPRPVGRPQESPPYGAQL